MSRSKATSDAAAPDVSCSTASGDSNSSSSSLSIRIRDAYRTGETDGTLTLAAELLPKHSAEELILASVDAVAGNRGQAAGIINALLGSCCCGTDEEDAAAAASAGAAAAAETAWSILTAYDDLSDVIDVHPDLVTLCVTYTALVRGGEPYATMAEEVLDRARRMAKKAGGSRLRKAVASSRRKGSNRGVRATDAADTLAERYGSEMKVLHEDDDLVVLCKPAGMVCFHRRKTTAGKVGRKKKRGKKNGSGGTTDSPDQDEEEERRQEQQQIRNVADISLTDALADVNVPLSVLNPDGRGIVHRIDRGTSGCTVLAKTDEAHAVLVAEFFTRGTKKRYDALVPAMAVAASSSAAVSGVGQDDGGASSPPPPDQLELGGSGVIDAPVEGRPALSRYEVVDRYGDGAALRLRVETVTGRKHQVRVHCARALGRPLFLDPVYADNYPPAVGDAAFVAPAVPESIARCDDGIRQRFFLHASALSIPRLGVDVEAPLPPWWEVAIDGLKT